MKRKRQKQPITASNSFYCCTCDETMEGTEAFKKHLAGVHKRTDFKGSSKMIMHLDCADSYHSQYELLLHGLKFTQTTTSPRSKDNLLYHP